MYLRKKMDEMTLEELVVNLQRDYKFLESKLEELNSIQGSFFDLQYTQEFYRTSLKEDNRLQFSVFDF